MTHRDITSLERAFLLGVTLLTVTAPAFAAGNLVIEFNAPYNLVVDSNVCSPSTYAPRIATIGASVCNYGDAPLTEVVARIGDFSAKTPGVYPVRSNADVAATSPCLAGRGDFALIHLGDLVDATRYVGTLAPGDCSWQYWSFTYPRRQNLVRDDDTCGEPVWCSTNVPEDDLFLPFDVWATSREGIVDDDTWRVTMRNEISASANKIFPGGASWFNEPEVCQPGQTVVTNGINYELGVINKGFDNDGDGEPDYNAWLQPIGDVNWNPACFRLVDTQAQLQVGRPGGPTDIYDFDNNLYFTDIGTNNGVLGVVYYTFMCLGGACNVPLTPYQEAASGFDNEKFAGDYGTSTVTMKVTTPEIDLDKTLVDDSGDGIAQNGENLVYTITVENLGTEDLGAPDLGVPLVIRDSIPAGTSFAAGSTTDSFTGCACTATTLYSTDGGVGWSTVEPAIASDVTDLQWRVNEVFVAGAEITVTFGVDVDNPYAEPDPVIVNTAAGSFGDSPPFDEDDASIVTAGLNSIGDTVWNDDGGTTGTALDGIQNGDEAGIGPVVVTLYWDVNGDGLLDSGDLAVRQETSAAGTGAYLFDQVPDGDWIVAVEPDDPGSTGIPTGYANTTPEVVAVTGLGVGVGPAVDVLTVDFGYGPSLLVDKTRTSAPIAVEGELVTFDIDVINTRPSSNAACTYDVWGESLRVASSFANPTNALGAGGPDGLYAESDGGGSGDDIDVEDWSLGVNPGSITQVEVIFQIDLTQALVDDDLDVDLFVAGASEGTNTFPTATLNTYVNKPGELVWDVTAFRAWDWTDFPAGSPAAYTSVLADFKHNGQADAGILRIDAIGFRVTSDQICGGNGTDDMNPVPLRDAYDPTLLQFVSADPPQTDLAGGFIDWANVGPLLGGETRTVTVTFRALEPAGDIDTLTTNTASVAAVNPLYGGATFVNGTPTNDDSGADTVTIRPAGEIGDRIWNDNVTTGDYIQNAGEAGIPGVTVTLCIDDAAPVGCTVADSVFLTTTTDANGDYLFSGLPDAGAPGADTYRIEVDTTTLPGSTSDLTGDPTVGACAIFPAPDPPGCDNFSTTIIAPGDGNPGNNFDLAQDYAYTIPTTVFGNVWEDNDGDAVQGDGLGDFQGEDPFAGVTVELCVDDTAPFGDCTAADSVFQTTTTDANGDYLFSDLAGGTYTVEVVTTTLPTGPVWNQTVDPDAMLDSLHTVAVAAGAISGSHDFAYQATGAGAIDGAVYADWNGDGTQDPAVPTPEEGIAGVTVFLYEDEDGDGIVDPEDALIASTVTAADGSYSFINLGTSAAGESYTVVVDETDPDLPATWRQTEDPDEAGVCATCDADGGVTLTDAAPIATDVDFGYQPRGFGIIGDTVFVDTDGSGLQDLPGEPGIANITVTLYEDQDGDGILDPEDAVIATTSTDVNGEYTFFDLPAGDYLVDVDTTDPQIPTDGSGNPYVLSTANDPDPVNLATDSSIVLDADFGFAPGGTIGDTVWRDDDGDGLLDTNEQGIPSITVSLYRDVDGDGFFEPGGDDGAAIATTSTDANGLYEFTGLDADDYFVEVDQADAQLPAGSTLTGDPDETGPCATCDAVTLVSLAPAQIIRFADFGFQPGGTIGDAVWIDDEDTTDLIPGNGIYCDVNALVAGTCTVLETGIADITVNLYVDDGDGIFEPGAGDGAPIATTLTDENGYYTFAELANLTYWVEIVTSDPDFPANATQTVDPDEAFPCSACNSAGLVTLTALNNNIDTIDFGYGLTPVPVITIDKDTSTPKTFAGGTAEYTIVVRNIGDAGTVANVSDTLPAGFTLSGTTTNTFTGLATGPGTCASLALCGNFTLPAGTSVTIAFTVDVATTVADGTYDNTASTTYDTTGNGTPDTTVDDDGLTAQDADTPPNADPEEDEDVTISPLPEYGIVKASSIPGGDGFIDPNDTFTYTVTITNLGTALATDITVNDPLPIGLSSVTGTTLVDFWQNGTPVTYGHNFNAPANVDTGSTGSVDWTTSPWTRSANATFAADGGNEVLRLENSVTTATRPVDLLPYSLGTLSFDYRRFALDPGEYVAIEVTADVTAGSPTWVELDRFESTGVNTTDPAYVSTSYDLLNYMRPGTFALRFITSGGGNNEGMFVDNLQLEVTPRVQVLDQAGGDPPNLITPGDGFSLLPDGLQPGENIVIDFQVTAADALGLTGLSTITNTASVTSNEIPEPRFDSVTDPVRLPGTAWSIAGTVWDDDGTGGGNRDGILDASEPLLENVRVCLYDAAGTTLIRCVLTAADGTYSFDNLTAASYVVRVDESTLPAGYTQSGDPDFPSANCGVSCDSEFTATDPGSGGTVTADFGYENDPTPLPVTLAWFRAVTNGDGVLVEWVTETETRNFGFFLYGDVDDEWRPINDDIVPTLAFDSAEPLSYSYQIDGFDFDTFLLIDLDSKGQARFHGPFTLDDPEVEARPKAEPIPWDQIRKGHLAKRKARHGSWKRKDLPPVRLTVREEGLYRVTFDDLLAAGIDLSGVPLAHLALSDPTGPVPLYVAGNGTFGPGAAFEFYAEAFESLYTDANAYTLHFEPSGGLRVDEDRTPPSLFGVPETTYLETVRVEHDREYHFASSNGDPWYDRRVQAFDNPSQTTLTVEVDEYVAGAGAVTAFVDIWGLTDWTTVDPDHHLRLKVNGHELADEIFDGNEHRPLVGEVPPDELSEGPNELVVELPLDVGVNYDIYGLDSYGVTYPRRLVARDGHLAFRGEPAESFSVSGLPSAEPAVYRVDDRGVSRLTRLEIIGMPGDYTVTFAGAEDVATYLVATPTTYLTPAAIEPAPPLEDITTGEAEYLVITHPDFIGGLDELLDRRQADGFAVDVVDVFQIYEQWNGGVRDAAPIQEYIRFAAAERGTRYVLLVGGDSYDYKDHLGLGSISFIPSLYVPSGDIVSFAPADGLYGDLDGDGVPDLPVGRFPVRSEVELAAIVAKTLAYEAKDYGRTLMSATDGYDSYQRISFVDTSAEILTGIDPSWEVAHVDIDELGIVTARERVIEEFDAGKAIAQYFGHSSYNIWSYQFLFAGPWVDQLDNAGRPAVVAQWGCWNTYYVTPLANTLAHLLMLNGEHGAAAVLGAATLTDSRSDVALGRHYLPLLTRAGATVGDALVAAKQALSAEHPEMIDVIVGWSILGDPALVIEPAGSSAERSGEIFSDGFESGDVALWN